MNLRLFLTFSSLIGISCNNNPMKEYADTPTTGKINIAVDENFRSVFESQIESFRSVYKHAEIYANYIPESEAFKSLINDSCRLIICTRLLNKEEAGYFTEIQLTPKVTKIAYDAIALITNKENPDSILDVHEVESVLTGKVRSWSELQSNSIEGDIRIVFDHSKSGTARYFRDKFLGGGEFPSNCFAANSNEEVINYCHKNLNALGLIGVNWISDGDDPASLSFKNKIRVLAIRPMDDPEGQPRAYKPYQAYIAQGFYPFTREVFIISREARSGLGSGFTAFVAGDIGQRIFLKSGIMPATKPVRIVNFRTGS